MTKIDLGTARACSEEQPAQAPSLSPQSQRVCSYRGAAACERPWVQEPQFSTVNFMKSKH